MIPPEKVSLSDFVTRRLHPTKVTLAFLRHEVKGPGGATVAFDRAELASVIATLELFVEDYEKLVNRDVRPAAASAAPAAVADRSGAYISDARA